MYTFAEWDILTKLYIYIIYIYIYIYIYMYTYTYMCMYNQRFQIFAGYLLYEDDDVFQRDTNCKYLYIP